MAAKAGLLTGEREHSVRLEVLARAAGHVLDAEIVGEAGDGGDTVFPYRTPAPTRGTGSR